MPQARSGRAATIDAARAEALPTHDVTVSVATVSRNMRRLGITLQKVLRATEQDSDRRTPWREALDQYDLAALVFVDESGTNLAMTPRVGRAPRGEQVVGAASRNYEPNTTLVAALSLDGKPAAMTVEGAMDRLAFDVFVTQIMALRPGQVMIRDNLSVHQSAVARRAIAARGCQVLWLPPYSPDFAPIEQTFSTPRTALRRSGARTRAALDEVITATLATLTATDAQGWFAHCGYPIPAQLVC